MHRRFPTTYTPAVVALLAAALAPPPRNTGAPIPSELKEKEDSARVSRQRPVLRVSAELALVGIIRDRDDPKRSGGECIMKTMKELVCLVYPTLLSERPFIHFIFRIAFQRSNTFISTITLDVLEIILSPIPRTHATCYNEQATSKREHGTCFTISGRIWERSC